MLVPNITLHTYVGLSAFEIPVNVCPQIDKKKFFLKCFHISSIHPFSIPDSSILDRWGAGAYLQWAKGGAHPGQVSSPLQDNTETHRRNNHAHTQSHLRAI
ncbi:hypothetical protein ILYODFUR_030223 [Ilyodon furcidens]|uniref:Uncharacterized protein n=1 Tax=Ilyodon furcidens TaxID=33524 RepID=A0ABV0T352_9TELE